MSLFLAGARGGKAGARGHRKRHDDMGWIKSDGCGGSWWQLVLVVVALA